MRSSIHIANLPAQASIIYPLQPRHLPRRLIQPKPILLHPPNPHINPIQRPSSLRTLRKPLLIPLRRRRNPQRRPLKRTTRHIPRRQHDLAHELSSRRDPQHLAIAIHGLPDIAVDVDGEAVGLGGRGERPEDARVRDGAAGGRVVVGVDDALGGVHEVERGVGEGPADGVGDDEVGAVGGAG